MIKSLPLILLKVSANALLDVPAQFGIKSAGKIVLHLQGDKIGFSVNLAANNPLFAAANALAGTFNSPINFMEPDFKQSHVWAEGSIQASVALGLTLKSSASLKLCFTPALCGGVVVDVEWDAKAGGDAGITMAANSGGNITAGDVALGPALTAVPCLPPHSLLPYHGDRLQ